MAFELPKQRVLSVLPPVSEHGNAIVTVGGNLNRRRQRSPLPVNDGLADRSRPLTSLRIGART